MLPRDSSNSAFRQAVGASTDIPTGPAIVCSALSGHRKRNFSGTHKKRLSGEIQTGRLWPAYNFWQRSSEGRTGALTVNLRVLSGNVLLSKTLESNR
jgi:hypothetical protein